MCYFFGGGNVNNKFDSAFDSKAIMAKGEGPRKTNFPRFFFPFFLLGRRKEEASHRSVLSNFRERDWSGQVKKGFFFTFEISSSYIPLGKSELVQVCFQ